MARRDADGEVLDVLIQSRRNKRWAEGALRYLHLRSASEHVSRHLLHPDLFLNRRSLELSQAVGGRDRQARRCLRREPLRLRHLGRAVDFMAVLRWRNRRWLVEPSAWGCTMTEPDLGAELRKLEVEPLLPIEKKLIG